MTFWTPPLMDPGGNPRMISMGIENPWYVMQPSDERFGASQVRDDARCVHPSDDEFQVFQSGSVDWKVPTRWI